MEPTLDSEADPMTLTLEEAQSRLREVVRSLSPGDEVTITDDARTVAKLVAAPAAPPSGCGPRPAC
jgi:antitoxin (DNA-binding transcriptional repressor) of toxin-antitoxin stability system